MKTPIREGSSVRRNGETEVGVVAFIDSTYAQVEYLSIDGKCRAVFLPLSVLEVVGSQPRETPMPIGRIGW